MRAFKWVPLLLILAFIKFMFTSAYLLGSKSNLWSWGIKEAEAAPQKMASKGDKKAESKKDLDFPDCPEALFKALKAEKEKIARERLALEKKKKDLTLLEEQVNRRLATLKTLEEELDKKLTELRTIKTKRFKLLVGAYGNMKPSKAAKLLVAMEPEMAIKILSALKTDQVARILSAMPPDKAASLAESLSGLPPREM